ncbi:hypothetical protein ACU8V3_15075 [Cobetia marina]
MSGDDEQIGLTIAVWTISDTRTEGTDRSGDTLVESLTAAGHTLHEKHIVPDDIISCAPW